MAYEIQGLLPPGDLLTEPEPSAPDGGEIQGSSGSAWKLILRTFVENRLAVVGIGLVILIVLFSFFGPLLYHTNQTVPNLINVNNKPGPGAPLGDDSEGYDILGRMMAGGSVSLEIAFAVAFVTIVVGVIYGAIAGYFGKLVDTLLMRVVDIFLAIPTIYLYIDLSGIFKVDKTLLILVLAGVSWLGPARLVRGETLSLRDREYVQSVRVMGGKPSRIILRHLVPNAVGTIVVQATFLIADAILVLTTLEFLGLGLPTSVPTWGGMLDGGTSFMSDGYWWEIYPVMIIIILTVVAFNLIGDALRDSLDVRLQRR